MTPQEFETLAKVSYQKAAKTKKPLALTMAKDAMVMVGGQLSAGLKGQVDVFMVDEDKFVHQVLTAPTKLGASVNVSRDGLTVMAASSDERGVGMVYVFRRYVGGPWFTYSISEVIECPTIETMGFGDEIEISDCGDFVLISNGNRKEVKHLFNFIVGQQKWVYVGGFGS